MKRLPIVIAIAVVLTTALLVSSVAAVQDVKGNGIPYNGQHFTLNIIGQVNAKNMPQGLSGHTIFVNLNKNGFARTDINLTVGDDFKVLDKDGTNGNAAFQLPYPLESDGVTACYHIFVRALGNPDGYANMYTCYWDYQTSTQWCDTETEVVIKRPDDRKGVGKFQDVTRELTFVNGVPIFSDPYDEYWWRYDNYGLRHAQLRFYFTGTCDDAPT